MHISHLMCAGLSVLCVTSTTTTRADDSPSSEQYRRSRAKLLVETGYSHLEHGDLAVALTSCCAARDEFPETPEPHACIAILLIHEGEYWQASKHARIAIAANIDDAGQFIIASTRDSNREVRDTHHGDNQVDAVLHDCPQLATYISNIRGLREYLSHAFDGGAVTGPIEWDSTEPESYEAVHLAPHGDLPAVIRVSKKHKTGALRGKQKSGEVVLRDIVFELNNLRNTAAFESLDRKAQAGAIEQTEFVRAYALLEAQAMQRTRAAYVKHVLPMLDGSFPVSNPSLWHLHNWGLIKHAGASIHGEKREYPWRPYGGYYLVQRCYAHYSDGKYAELLALLSENYEIYCSDATQLYLRSLAGTSYLSMSEHSKAEELFTVNLEHAPDRVEDLIGRGSARMRMGAHDRALDDIKRAQGLAPNNVHVHELMKELKYSQGSQAQPDEGGKDDD